MKVFASEAYVQKETPDVPAGPVRGYAPRTFHELDHKATRTNGGRPGTFFRLKLSHQRTSQSAACAVVGPT